MTVPASVLDLVLADGRKKNPGRRALPIEYEVLRELQDSDVELALAAPPLGSKPTPLAKLRHSHHKLAQLLADGTSGVEAAAIVGYSPVRVSILKSDPAFRELVEFYASKKREAYVDVHERLATLGTVAVEELQERLEDKPEGFTNKELFELVGLTMDRSVAPVKGVKGGSGAPTSLPPTISIQFVAPPPAKELSGPTIDLELELPHE